MFYIDCYPAIADTARRLSCSGGTVFGTNSAEQGHLNDAIAKARRVHGAIVMRDAEADLADMDSYMRDEMAHPEDPEEVADLHSAVNKVLETIYE